MKAEEEGKVGIKTDKKEGRREVERKRTKYEKKNKEN